MHLRYFYSQALNGRIIGFFGTEIDQASRGEDLSILIDLVADGRLDPRIGFRDHWPRTADAFAAMARRELRGKAERRC